MGRVQTGVFDNLIRRLYSIKGGGSELSETLGDVFPVLDLENLPSELRALRGWVLGMGRISNVSGVGAVNSHQLFNPAGSNKLVVVTSIWVACSAGTLVNYGPAFTALVDASVAGTQRDTRPGSIKPTTSLLQEEDDGTASVFSELHILANQSIQITDPDNLMVLIPGTALRLNAQATNVTLRTAWMWRERVAEPSELSF